ncbi:helix-turn-helix domain-containing protein [Ekhidna lutea]|uniref:helix-turn-helix domain-containing protein n=1 Tax=Ekhidna lutea TaxID=447679 RepID=UPI0015C619D0|nr:helix-turn-helix domain-containing protein [Ekhidna lutea]
MIFTLSDFFTIADGFERARHLRENFLDRFLYYNYLRSGHIIAYGLYVVYLIRMHWSEVRTSERLYVVSISTIYFISAAVVSLLTEFANSYRDFIWYYLLSSGVSLVIGILLYRDPDFLQNIKKYLRSSLSPSEMKRISNAIKREFESKKLFLKRDMCVNELADLIGEASHKISQTLSVQIGQNFNDYINKFRIEHAKSLLVDPKHDHFKIEAIAMDSGFNNKVTFYKAFTKETGTTPSAYRRAKRS